MINRLGKETRDLLEQAVQIAYFSRGSIQYESVLKMSPLERDIVVAFINKRLEQAAKSPFPVF